MSEGEQCKLYEIARLMSKIVARGSMFSENGDFRGSAKWIVVGLLPKRTSRTPFDFSPMLCNKEFDVSGR
jgi:hypothetical protein